MVKMRLQVIHKVFTHLSLAFIGFIQWLLIISSVLIGTISALAAMPLCVMTSVNQPDQSFELIAILLEVGGFLLTFPYDIFAIHQKWRIAIRAILACACLYFLITYGRICLTPNSWAVFRPSDQVDIFPLWVLLGGVCGLCFRLCVSTVDANFSPKLPNSKMQVFQLMMLFIVAFLVGAICLNGLYLVPQNLLPNIVSCPNYFGAPNLYGGISSMVICFVVYVVPPLLETAVVKLKSAQTNS